MLVCRRARMVMQDNQAKLLFDIIDADGDGSLVSVT